MIASTTTLQWLIGGSAAGFAGLWIGFFLFANNFRRSFGARKNAAWTGVLPVAVATLILLSVLLPGNGVVLAATGAAVLAVSVGALRIAPRAPILVGVWFAYAGVWVTYLVMVL